MRNVIGSLLCLGLLGAALGRAAETDRQELTTEEAKRLAQDRSGRLLLNGLTKLSADAAKELAKHDGWLSLNGLTTLSNEAAEAFGQHKGQLHLDGLTSLSPEAARALARHNGELSLNGLTSLSDEAGVAFAKHTGGRLYLKGVKTLSTEVGKALAQRKGGGPSHKVCLDGVETLSVEAAEALAETHGHNWDGRFPAMKTIPENVARALARRPGGISLEGLTALSDDAAKALGGKLGGNLPRLTALLPEAAKVLAQSRGGLNFDGLKTLPDETAKELEKSGAALSLNGLTTLSPVAARAISKREGDIYLNGLTTVSYEALKALMEHKSPGYARPVVYLNGLTILSDDGAAVLASWPKWSGALPALPTLSEKTATALASSRNWDGRLPAVKLLSPEAARALAQRQGNLTLDGLTTLSDEVATALVQHRGGTLSLNGLKDLSDRVATALAPHNGRLSLNGLATLSSGAAKALAEHKGDWLFLDGLTTLTDESAKALAQHPGVVSLTGLQAISDESVRVLKANPKIALADKFRMRAVVQKPVAADVMFVRSFLDAHCADCHDAKRNEGDFTLDKLAKDDVAGRVAYASILERLRAGDMPPSAKKTRPDAAEAAGVAKWIEGKLGSPMAEKPAYYDVKEKPIDGNRLPNAILFGGPRGPSVPPPPRLWRVSPTAYSSWLGDFKANGLQQPFGVIQESGFKDFSALYAPDEGATGLLLSNAEQIVAAQARPHAIVNVNDNPAAAKESLWPNDARAKIATDAERVHLKKGVRVRGGGVFAPLMHPSVKANKEELEKALQQQYMTAIARPPSDKELESLIALYHEVARDGDMALAGKTVLMAPLMTPEAILRFEVGMGAEVRPGVRMLSPRETAFALSLALSNKRDPGLLTAAAQGKLTTRQEAAESVQRILDDPRISKSRVMWFLREYFDYYRAPEVFKDPLPDYLQRRGIHFNPRGYVDDTDVLVLSILSRDKDVLKELLTTPESYGTHELFGPVGPLDGLRSGEAMFRLFGPVALAHRRPPQGDRIGIPMQPSWQAAWSTNFHNDIVRRGRWVREHLLGGRVPDLPIDAAAMIPDDPHHTLRVRQMVTRAGACWKCHNKMDELGLPFEDVDHYGFPRPGEQVLDLEAMAQSKEKNKIYRNAPLDTTGFIAFSGDPKLDGPVKDAPEMLRRLAESDRVRQVFIRHVFRYFLGRNETPGDAISLQEAEKAYVDGGGSFKALLVSLLASESFLYRTMPAVASTEGAKK